MTREELEHIIRASAEITDQYEFVSWAASRSRSLRATIRRWAKALRDAGHDIADA